MGAGLLLATMSAMELAGFDNGPEGIIMPLCGRVGSLFLVSVLGTSGTGKSHGLGTIAAGIILSDRLEIDLKTKQETNQVAAQTTPLPLS